ncbi:MAG: MarR family transcriptional regulator [Gammaproteobacteria bacterium]|nr:MarR family transcriptional regulator [Gammaproteobacteria bacterium]MCP5199170.1 MarR family transcriptional regulator [Gammaproteobacteria bacterium]
MVTPSRAAPRHGPDFYAGDDYVIDESYGYLVRRLHASLQRHIERRMQPLDLTAMQWAPLLLLAEGKADTGAELARWMNIDTGAMTRMLDRLEGKGLLERRRCAADRRVVRLILTSEGEAAVARVPAILAEVLNLHLAGFEAAELSTLMGYLHRMLDNGAREEPA